MRSHLTLLCTVKCQHSVAAALSNELCWQHGCLRFRIFLLSGRSDGNLLQWSAKKVAPNKHLCYRNIVAETLVLMCACVCVFFHGREATRHVVAPSCVSTVTHCLRCQVERFYWDALGVGFSFPAKCCCLISVTESESFSSCSGTVTIRLCLSI